MRCEERGVSRGGRCESRGGEWRQRVPEDDDMVQCCSLASNKEYGVQLSFDKGGGVVVYGEGRRSDVM